MSGYKRATLQINEEEYRRLHEADMRLRKLEKNVNDQLHKAARQNRASLVDQARQFEERQNTYNHLITGLTGQVQYLEVEANRALREQQQVFYQAINDNNNTLWTEVFDLLNQHSCYFDNLINEERYQREREYRQLYDSVNGLYDDQAKKHQLASSWLDTANGLLQFVRNNYNCDKFAPGWFAQLNNRLWQAADNLANGVPEGTILETQQMVTEISQRRIEIERSERSWNLLFYSIFEWAAWLYNLALDNQECEALDLDGQPLGMRIDVNYWTSGQLGRIIKYLDRFLQELETNPDQIDEEELRRYLEIELPQVEQALDEIVYQARLKALNSQLRINIADLVVQALESQGFSVNKAGYSEDDMRKDFCASVVNRQGSEIIIDVAPTSADYGMNELHLLSKDAEERTEHELNQRTKEISKALQFFGLEIGALETPAPSEPRQPKYKPVQSPDRLKRDTPATSPG